MTKRRKDPIDAYFRGLPGRRRPAPKGKKSDDLLEPWILERGLELEAAAGHKLRCWCEVCGVQVAADLPVSENDVLELGDHRHDDDVAPGLVRWYRLRAIGTWKEAHVTTVAEMLANHPLFTRGGFPAPSQAVMSDALLVGRYDPPRAAGIEFPPLQLEPDAWPELRLELVLRRPALVDTEIPDDVTTMQGLEQWWGEKLESFSAAARQHQRDLIFEAGQNMDGLAYDTPEWYAALAKVHALQANTLMVLENYDR